MTKVGLRRRQVRKKVNDTFQKERNSRTISYRLKTSIVSLMPLYIQNLTFDSKS